MKSGLEQPAEAVLAHVPHLIADVTFYPTDEGGAAQIKLPGWGCLCFESKDSHIKGEDGRSYLFGHDGWPQLREPLKPGEQRRLGFVFLSSGEESALALRKAGTFYLWEGRFIGEAVVVQENNQGHDAV